jgi:hypothetical protein
MMTTAQHCQCTGCHKCDRQSGNYCRRSVVYDVDHLCEECHTHAHASRLDGGSLSFLRGGGAGRTARPSSRLREALLCTTRRMTALASRPAYVSIYETAMPTE